MTSTERSRDSRAGRTTKSDLFAGLRKSLKKPAEPATKSGPDAQHEETARLKDRIVEPESPLTLRDIDRDAPHEP
jgi:hypothetical protein